MKTLYASEENLLEVSTVQKPPVGGNFCLQLHLDVQQSLVLLSLVLDVVAQVCELRLQLQDDGVETLDLHIVTHFCITQGGLQGSFLENEAKRTQELGLSQLHEEQVSRQIQDMILGKIQLYRIKGLESPDAKW